MRKRFGRLFSFLLAAMLLFTACKSSTGKETLPSLEEATGSLTSPTTQSEETVPPETDVPATQPTVTVPPATNPPATNPPATNPPATNPPATNPPATNPPATNPPATNPPATNPPATNPPATNPPVTNPPAQILSDYAEQVLTIVNQERAAQGRAPLAMDEQACAAALVRAKELETLFSHTRPDGNDCFTVFEEFNISYRMAGENIAMGYPTPEDVMVGWMNSQGHRDNILNENYTHIGIACVYIPNSPSGVYWVQLFLCKWNTP